MRASGFTPRREQRIARETAIGRAVRRVADYLVSVQEADGYLGTYAPDRRFMHKQPPSRSTWDGAPSQRTWDIWTHSYLILGLLEVNRYFPATRTLKRLAGSAICVWHTLTEGGIDITQLGNHHGMSATVLLDGAWSSTSRPARTYLNLAKLILKQADERAGLQLLSQALAGADASEIAPARHISSCWNLVGLAKLHRATGDAPTCARS